ncbi:phage virion morphogenesis protein [Helicobacter sp.]|uniref:phage virion morphogenesis protein n=1 Tax=Helicobacter sp. TaxID=218 RepID=UPI001996148D|nr:phage virion morphogenesis protein [Helicobacter sp.]MBD5164587.1 phage virion morphogenesis protein [Helicobacter sp.]
MAEIIISIEELQGKLERLSKALENKTPLLRRIANTLQNVTEESFDKQASPFGEKWKSNSPRTLQKKRGNKILIQSGLLSQSFTQKVTGNSAQVGTNKQYAAIHQFGGKAGRNKRVTIPVRPFMPINKNGEIPKDLGERLEGEVVDYLKNYLEY